MKNKQCGLTSTHINLAAKIYALSIVALGGAAGGASENDDEYKVVVKTIKDAENKFRKMFPNEGHMPPTLPDCVELAIRSKQS